MQGSATRLSESSRETVESVSFLANSTQSPGADPKNITGRHLLQVPDRPFAGGMSYIEFFRLVNERLQPRSYFEVGTERGASLAAFTCSAVCVDPKFRLNRIDFAARSELHFYQMSSDAFFSRHRLRDILGDGPDVCFLDGMHRAEYLLRDFMHTERSCHRRSVIFLHDCLPANARMTSRVPGIGDASEGETRSWWTGDVWKIIPVLRKFRPDLKLFLLDCAPTGLVLVSNLDPGSAVLETAYGDVVDELRDLDLDKYPIRNLWTEYPAISSRSLAECPEDLTQFLDIH